MYMYNGFILLYRIKQCNIVNQLYSNIFFFKKDGEFGVRRPGSLSSRYQVQ